MTKKEPSTYSLYFSVKLEEGLGRLNWDSQDKRTAILARAGTDGDILITGQPSDEDYESSQEDRKPRRRAGDLL